MFDSFIKNSLWKKDPNIEIIKSAISYVNYIIEVLNKIKNLERNHKLVNVLQIGRRGSWICQICTY